MEPFEWKGVVRVRLGEITRGQQLELWRLMRQDEDATDEELVLQNQQINALVAAYATRKVSVCQGDKWVDVGETAQDFDVGFDVITLTKPKSASDFDAFPRSLASDWIDAAVEANGGFVSVMSFSSASPTSSDAGSEPKPASE
jgi:hypothetical protein